MPQEERDVLQVLKAELNFVQKGGYGRSPRDPFRAQLIFEDSPTCMNYDTKDHPTPCSDCVLMRFVPAEKRNEKVPCLHIPLNAAGQSVFELYQEGETQPEVEGALSGWLHETIAHFEALNPGSKKMNSAAAPERVSV